MEEDKKCHEEVHFKVSEQQEKAPIYLLNNE